MPRKVYPGPNNSKNRKKDSVVSGDYCVFLTIFL